MAVIIDERLMELGNWTIDADWNAAVYDDLLSGYHALVYDEQGTLTYVGVIRKRAGDRRGIAIGGPNMEHWLGLGDDGPLIERREFISGRNKLSNPTFAPLGLEHWKVGEGTKWIIVGIAGVPSGGIWNPSALDKDDVLACTESWDVRPGDLYRAEASVTGHPGVFGGLRLRTIYTGTFNPLQLFTNPDFELPGGWSLEGTVITREAGQGRNGSTALAIGPIPKPQLVSNSGFEAGMADWSPADQVTVVTDAALAFEGSRVLALGAIPKPQLVTNSDFEAGMAGWSASTEMAVAAGGFGGGNALVLATIPKPQLVSNSGFEAGMADWSAAANMEVVPGGGLGGGSGLWCWPIPYPELLTDGGFEGGGTGWSIGPAFSVVGSGAYAGTKALAALPNPQPQYVADPGLEGAPGAWTQSGGSANDMAVGATAEAYAGAKAMRAGPISPQQILADPGAETGGFWFQNPPNLWYHDPTAPLEGAMSMSTSGGGGPTKQIQSDSDPNTAGSQVYTVVPGEEYSYTAHIRKDTGTDGYAYISAHIPHPSNAAGDVWHKGFPAITEDAQANFWHYTAVPNGIRIPPGRTSLRVLCEVWDHTTGKWSFDNIFLIRVRGNSARMLLGQSVPVTAANQYRLTAKVKSDDNTPAGEVRLGVLLTGPGKVDQEFETSQRETDFSWVSQRVNVRPENGYTTAWIYVRGVDILGGSFYVDDIEFRKTSNNVDTTSHPAVAITAEQDYRLSAAVRSGPGVEGGDITIGLTLSGAGKPDVVRSVTQGNTSNEYRNVSVTARPLAGYTSAVAWVRSRDVLVGPSDYFYVDSVALQKVSNNTRQTNHSPFAVTPNQRYTLRTDVYAGVGVKRGSVIVGATLSGPGLADQSYELSQGNTDGEWVHLSTDFTPEDGYTTAVVWVRSIDVEGDAFIVDNVTLEKADGNVRQTNHSSFAVTPNQRYTLRTDVLSPAAVTRGTALVGLTLSGTGVAEQTFELSQGNTDGEWVHLSTDLTPEDGYTTAVAWVRSVDVEGGSISVDNVTLEKADGNVRQTNHASFPVIPEQKYLLAATSRSVAATAGEAVVGVVLSGAGLADEEVPIGFDLGEGEWAAQSTSVVPPPGYTSAVAFVRSVDTEGGTIYVDNVTLTKMDNNRASSVGQAIAVTPEREYTVTAVVRSAAIEQGNVRIAMRCQGTGRDDVVVELTTAGDTTSDAGVEEWVVVESTFTPPSGYDLATPSLVGTDIDAGRIYVDDLSMRDADDGTKVVDVVARGLGTQTITVDTTAPVGAERVSVEVIAEAKAFPWVVNEVSLARRELPWTGHAVIGNLLRDPDDGSLLSVVAGNLVSPDYISRDWEVLNLYARPALEQFCRVISVPPLEWGLNHADRTLDVGPPEAIFVDHAPGSDSPIIYLERDIDVKVIPRVEENTIGRVSRVKVIGAERPSSTGPPTLITATRHITTTERDWNNREPNRTKLVEDSTANHVDHAQALADEQAERNVVAPVATSVSLTPSATRAPSRPGDWVYVYKPESGLLDLTNPVQVRGRTVYPKKARLIARVHRPTRGSVVIRRSDGTTFPLPGVRWNKRGETTLDLDNRRPEYQGDSHAGNPGRRFLRLRASRPR